MYFRIFDCWRFAAALLVMTYHFLYFAPGAAAYTETEYLHRLLPLLDMFFMISGFVIMARYHDKVGSLPAYAGFLRRRIARLYPLHLLTLGFFVCVALAGSAGLVTLAQPERWRYSDIPLQLLGIHAWGTTSELAFNYPSWSVSAEIFCYLLFPLVPFIARRIGARGLALVLLAYVACLEGLSRAGAFPSGHWTDADTLGAYRALADFLAGGLAALLVSRRAINVTSHAPGLLSLALAIGCMLTQTDVYATLVFLFGAILLIGLSESARPNSTRVLDPIMPLTRVSFGIYLWHPVMETLFLSILWKRVVAPTGWIDFHVYLLLPMLASVLVAYAWQYSLEERFAGFLAGTPRAKRAAPGRLVKA
ncbi:acyltransferase [Aureimonas sp. AU20]|uniref:acyltransferase family protein n=1 Tax=Aureimonas sp. AU20 TaxID=1349819 RepID=UPI000720C2E9|nr:acyltransferase [Aureimonas sp. AU20]ALN71118.1 hypothetical protein M673_00255 [Aureimonas sp. AU20]